MNGNPFFTWILHESYNPQKLWKILTFSFSSGIFALLFIINYWLKYDFPSSPVRLTSAQRHPLPLPPHVITWIEWNGGNYTNERKIINSTFSEILKIIRQKVWIRNGYCSWQRSASKPSRQNNNNQHLRRLLLSLNLGQQYSLVFWLEIVKNARNPRNPTCKIGDLIFDDCWIGWD